MTWIAPNSISAPVAPMKPPTTGYGMKRMAPPARSRPSPHSTSPVSAVASVITTMAGSNSRMSPAPARCATIVATKAAVTAEVDESGPGDGEGQRAAPRHDCRSDGRRQECRRQPVGQIARQRTGKDERRIGQAIGDRQHAADRTGEDVAQAGSNARAAKYRLERTCERHTCPVDRNACRQSRLSGAVSATLRPGKARVPRPAVPRSAD
jgi:hypothetical protein